MSLYELTLTLLSSLLSYRFRVIGEARAALLQINVEPHWLKRRTSELSLDAIQETVNLSHWKWTLSSQISSLSLP